MDNRINEKETLKKEIKELALKQADYYDEMIDRNLDKMTRLQSEITELTLANKKHKEKMRECLDKAKEMGE